MIAEKRDLLPVHPDGIPEELKARPQWVAWRLEKRDADFTKVPYTPSTGRKASSRDLLTWRPFEEALAAYRQGDCHGIGFMFSSADPYCGVDLDGCRNPTTGELAAWAEKIVDVLDGYAEVSPSGRGVHVVVRGKTPSRRRGAIEIYSSERFFTMTGQAL
jgi:putative DNA primase/helicase